MKNIHFFFINILIFIFSFDCINKKKFPDQLKFQIHATIKDNKIPINLKESPFLIAQKIIQHAPFVDEHRRRFNENKDNFRDCLILIVKEVLIDIKDDQREEISKKKMSYFLKIIIFIKKFIFIFF